MKKILIICYNFLPYYETIGGVIRVLSLADFLFRNGFEVYILTSRGYFFSYFGHEDELRRYHIIYIDNWVNMVFQKGLKKNVIKQATRSKLKNQIWSIIKNVLSRTRFFIEQLLPPDIGVLKIVSFYQIAKRIIRDNGISVVFISSPPHSMQLVGLLLKKFNNYNRPTIITDYRDSWNTTRIYARNTAVANWINRILERKVLLACDYFTFISEPMLTKAEVFFGINLRKKSHLVMNGFSEAINVKKYEPSNALSISIGYFGSIGDLPNSHRNISSLLNVLSENFKELSFLNFHFYGMLIIKFHNLKDYPMLHYHGSIDHRLAVSAMSNMDFLMIVHSEKNGADEVITGKLFEYISVKKPIICIGPTPMAAKQLIEKYGIGVTIDIENQKDIAEKLLSLRAISTNFYENVDISQFHRDNQYKKIINLLNI